MMYNLIIDRIFLASLANGIFMAIDTYHGTILWSISDEKILFDLKIFPNSTENEFKYFISTSGHLYRFVKDGVELVHYNKKGQVNFNNEYYHINSWQDTILMGVDLLSGKLHYYCDLISCINYNNESGDTVIPNNQITIKRTVYVMKMINITDGREIIKYEYGEHEVYLHNQDKSVIDEVDHESEIVRVYYDININTLYGIGSTKSTAFSYNCWKLELRSPLISSWLAKKKRGYISLTHIKFSDLLSINTNSMMTFSNLILKMSYDELEQNYHSCSDVMFLNIHNNKPILHSSDSQDNNPCKYAKIFSYYEFISNNKNNIIDLDDFMIDQDQIAKAVYDLITLKNKLNLYKNIVKRSFQLQLSWRRVHNRTFNITAPYQVVLNINRYHQITIKALFVYFWRELVGIGIVVSIVSIYIIKRINNNVDDNSQNSIAPFVETKRPIIIVAIITPVIIQKIDNPSVNQVISNSRFYKEYCNIKKIASGGFGTVFKAQNTLDKGKYAVKRIKIPDCVTEKEKVIKEVQALAKLSHPGIVRFFNAWFEDAHDEIKDENTDYSSQKSISIDLSRSLEPTLDDFEKNRNLSLISSDNKESDDSCPIVFEDSKNLPYENIWEGIPEATSTENSDSKEDESQTMSFSILQCANSTDCNHEKKIYIYIQMELCHKKTLYFWLLNNPRELIRSFSIFKQLIFALEYIHSHNLVHRDIKPSNIFFAKDQSIKIGDFGLVMKCNGSLHDSSSDQVPTHSSPKNTMTKNVGTSLYMSPEQIANKPYNSKIDVYSLGLILFETKEWIA